jgi:hypothetical protein
MANNVQITVNAIDNATATFGKIGSAVNATTGEIESLKNSLSALAAGAGFAGFGMKLVNDAKDYALAIRQVSLVTGSASDKVSEMMALFKYYGVDTDTATASMAKFGKAISKARDDMTTAAAKGEESNDIFSRLGLTFDDISKSNLMDIYQKVTEKVRGLTDAADKDRVAMELFGRSGYQMLDMLNATPGQVDAVIQKYQAMGLIMSEDNVDAAYKLDKQMNALQGTTLKLGISIGNELLPQISDEVKFIQDCVDNYTKMDDSTKKVIVGVIIAAVEFGVVKLAIEGVTKALGFMSVASEAASGKWLKIAEAIWLAYSALKAYNASKMDKVEVSSTEGVEVYWDTQKNQYVKKQWVDSSSTDYGGADVGGYFNYVPLNDEELEKIKSEDIDRTKGNNTDATTKKAADSLKKNADDVSNTIDEIGKKLDDKFKKLSNSSSPSSAAAAARKAQQEQEKAARAQEQVANAVKRNAELIQQANDRIASIIENLDQQYIELTGTQFEADMAHAKQQLQNTLKNISSATVSMQKLSVATNAAATSMENASNEQLVTSGNTDISRLTPDTVSATKMVLAYAKTLGISAPLITGGDESGHDANGWHPSGQAVDIGWSGLEWGDPLLAKLGEYARQFFKEIIYDPHGSGPHLHIGGPIGQTESASAPIEQAVTSMAQSVSQLSPELQAIVQASNELGFDDLKLAVAIAMRESGGDSIKDINMASGGGMFQISEGSTVKVNGEDAEIDKLYPNWRTDLVDNARAGIRMLQDKIANTGEKWAGVAAYNGSLPGGTYEQKIRNNYANVPDNLISGATNFGGSYVPARTAEARTKAYRNYDAQVAEYQRQQLIRERKQQEEITKIDAQNSGDRLAVIIAEKDAEIQANYDSLHDYVKSTGDTQKARELWMQKNNQIILNFEQKKREYRATEDDELLQHYSNLETMDSDYTNHLDESRKSELRLYIAYLKDQLENSQLTAEQQIKIETDLAEKVKSLRELNSKTFEGGMDSLLQTMKNYQMDAGSVLTEGWNSVTDTIEGSFDNMLTTQESFASRMKNLYINLANEILNVMMKIILRGLIMNSIMKAFGLGSSTSMFSSYGSSDISNFMASNNALSVDTNAFQVSDLSFHASGGKASGWAVVGEQGPELVNFTDPGRIYTAQQTAQALSGGGMQKVEVHIVNQTNQNVKADSANVTFDGEKYIITTVIKAVANDMYGMRTLMKGAVQT